MVKRHLGSNDEPRHPRKLAASSDKPTYPRKMTTPSEEALHPRRVAVPPQQNIHRRHIPVSPTPLSKSPPTAYRLIIRLPPKPIDPAPIIELLHLFLSRHEPITLQLSASSTSVEAAIVCKPDYADH